MNKHLTSILVAVVSLMCFSLRASATIYEVGTADEFMEHWKANDSIQLTADIDLGAFTKDNMCEKYTAELSGKRYDGEDYFYVVKNLKCMLAREMEGASIHNIQFQDCAPVWDYQFVQDSWNGFALLCRYSRGCKFEDVILDNIEVKGERNTYSSVGQETNNASCFVSQDDGSTFTGIYAGGCCSYAYNSWAGILCGTAKNSTFEDCGNTFDCGVYADGSADNSYAGGLVGEATSCQFTRCENMATVAGGKDCVGGIAGKSTNTTFRACNNYGSASIAKYGDGQAEAFTNSLKSKCNAMPKTFSSNELERFTAKVGMASMANFLYASVLDANTKWYLNRIQMHMRIVKTAAYNIDATRSYYHYLSIQESNADKGNLSLAEQYENQYLRENFDVAHQTQLFEKNYTNLVKRIGGGIEYSTEGDGVLADIENPDLMNDAFFTTYTYIAIGLAVVQTVYQIGHMVYDAQDSDDAGGICGLMNGGGAYECANYGMVYSADAYAGGIVGDAAGNKPVIENCLNQGLVKGYEQTGGIVGRIESGAVMACLNVGNVNAGNSTSSTFGRIYGQKDSGALSEGNYYAASALGAESDGCRGVTNKMLASGEAAQLLNKEAGFSAWRQTIGVDYYPSLQSTSDSLLAEKIQPNIDATVRTNNAATFLMALANQSSDIVLTGDIDLNTSMFNFSSRFMPFTGSIDGQGHQLKNVNYSIPTFTDRTGANDNRSTNVGLLSFARNATFKNLALSDFKVFSPNVRADTVALFVANSYKCTYDNVRIVGESSITASETTNTEINYPIYQVGGLVAYSDSDKFTNCYTGPMCKFESPRTSFTNETNEAGGLVAVAKGSSFEHCYNQASVTTSDDYVGGIVSHIIGGSITSCLNMGSITGEEQVGGIAGYATDANIKYCVNTGTITSYTGLTGNESEVGGIVGTFTQDNAKGNTLSECANWGAVVNAKSTDQCVYGETYGDPVIGTNYYSCIINGGGKWNVSVDYNSSSTGGGKWTEDYNYVNQKDIFYQDIDNNTFPTKMPVPIAAAGKVYKNIHCDGSAYYSNRYSNTANHTATPNKFNMCAVCGVKLENTAPADISITNADEMVDFRYAVNKNQDFKNSTITLANDIDLKDVDFAPIGTYTNPCNLGTFDGNYHHIKNLYVETTDGFGGLFGCITGDNMMIENVIIDSTCVVRTNGIAVAGLVGCVDSPNGDQVSLTISHCGNEASVAGTTNVAGILGSVFTNDNMVLNIENCYNTGTIKGDKESAAICGYARDHASITRTWNSGSVTGYDQGYPFVRYNTSKTLTADNCYDVNGQKNNGVPTFDTAELKSGRLTYLLNSSKDGVNSGNTYLTWCQKIGTDNHPVIKYSSDARVYHHDYSYCDAPTVVETFYNNSDDAVATIWHDYDEDGICTRKAGEVHGEPIQATGNVWHVTRPGDLYYIAQEVNNGNTQYDIELMNDVTDNELVQIAGYLSPYYQTFHAWTPIGTSEHPFTKSLNGNYHTISGLYCDRGIDGGSSQEPVGLFGALKDNPSVTNVSVQDCYFRSYWKVGLLAGSATNSTNSPIFHNIYTVGAVKGVSGLGGMIGFVQDKDFTANSISNCWTLTPVSREKDPTFGNYDEVNNGAIVGTVRTDATTPYVGNLTNCFYFKGATDFTSTFGTAKESYDFTSGDVCHLLNTVDGSELSTPVWGQNLGTESVPLFASAGLRHERSVSSNWGTVVLPYTLYSNDAVQLYKMVSCDASPEATTGTLTLKPVDQVAANTPCFFKKLDESATSVCFKENPGTFKLVNGGTGTVVSPILTDAGWSMVGSYGDLSDLKGVYYLAQDKLWYADEAITLPAYRAYMASVNPRYKCKSLSLLVLDDDDEVDEIVNINADGEDGPCYNLAGQRVTGSAKGIVIQKGIKYLKK